MEATRVLTAFAIAGLGILSGCQKDIKPGPGDAGSTVLARMPVPKDVQQIHMLKAVFDGSGVIELINASGECYAYGPFEGNCNLLGKFQGFFTNYGRYGGDPSLVDPFAPLTVNKAYLDFRSQYKDLPATSANNRGYYTIANLPMETLTTVSVVAFDKQGNAVLAHADSTQTVSIQGTFQAIKAYFAVTGGTGKFKGASGQYVLTGYSDLVAPFELTLHYELEGEIRY